MKTYLCLLLALAILRPVYGDDTACGDDVVSFSQPADRRNAPDSRSGSSVDRSDGRTFDIPSSQTGSSSGYGFQESGGGGAGNNDDLH